MIRRCIAAGLFIAIVSFSNQSGLGYDGVILKIRKPAKGDISSVDLRGTSMMKFENAGKDGDRGLQQSEEFINSFVEEILEVDDAKSPIKRKRVYDKAVRIVDGKKETAFDYQGKTLLISRNGKFNEYTIEGQKPLRDPQKIAFQWEFSKRRTNEGQFEELFLPAKPVKAGESWTIDPAKITSLFKGEKGTGKEFDRPTATGKLLTASVKDGQQYGKFEIRVVFPILPGKLDKRVEIEKDSQITMTILYDGNIDGTRTDFLSDVEIHSVIKGKENDKIASMIFGDRYIEKRSPANK